MVARRGFVAHRGFVVRSGFVARRGFVPRSGFIPRSSLVALKDVQDDGVVFVVLVDEDQGYLLPEPQVEWRRGVLAAVPRRGLQDPLQRRFDEPVQFFQQMLHL